MGGVLFAFPIDGRSVSAALRSASGPDDTWVLKSIETLSGGDTPILGDLWERCLAGDVVITTRDLCTALDQANQVIEFDAHLLEDVGVEIFIEDGYQVKDP